MQKFEGKGCLHQRAGEFNIDRVLGLYCRVRNRSQNLIIIHILCIKHMSGNHMHKCHWITWEGHNVGGTIGDSLLPTITDHLLNTVTVQYLC